MTFVTDLRKSIAGENLSSPNGAKWTAARSVVAQSLGITPSEVYCTFLGKSTQAQVRLGKQIRADVPYRVALAFGGDGKREASSYHTHAKRALQSFPTLDAVVLVFEEGGPGSRTWVPERVYFRQGSDLMGRIGAWSSSIVAEQLIISPSNSGLSRTNSREPIPPSFGGVTPAGVMQRLLLSKNVLLRGVPGVGKTFLCRGIVSDWQAVMGRPLGEYRFLVMHAAAAYEDLIEGLRPEGMLSGGSFVDPDKQALGGAFAPRLGRIAEFIKAAVSRPDCDFLLVLDEINRTNLSAAFGELLLLVESSKRARYDSSSGQWVPPLDGLVALAYSGRQLFVPDNLFVVATMNSSDRSISPMDRATLRRFDAIRVEPLDAAELDRFLVTSDASAQEAFEDCVSVWSAMNDALLYPHVGADAVVGHSALIGLADALSGGADPRLSAAAFLESALIGQVAHVLGEVGQEQLLFASADQGERAVSTCELVARILAKYGLRLELSGSGLGRKISVESA